MIHPRTGWAREQVAACAVGQDTTTERLISHSALNIVIAGNNEDLVSQLKQWSNQLVEHKIELAVIARIHNISG